MSVISPPGYLQASSYAAADDRRNIVSALAQRSIRDTFNTGARGGWVVGKLPSWSAAAWAVTVSPATGVVENTFASNGGEYVGFNTANQLLTHTASSGTLNRIDIVGMVIDDAFYSGAVNDGKLEILQGTAVSGTPVAPTIPNTFLPIYQASIPAGSSTPTFTTMVKVTTAAGGIPVITTAQLADAGGFVGEQRGILTAGAPLPGVLYSYYGSDALWHGIQDFVLPRPTQTGSGSIATNGIATIAQVTIPDPGFKYHIEASGQFEWNQTGSLGAATIDAFAYVQVNSAALDTNVISNAYRENTTATNGTGYVTNSGNGNSKVLSAGGFSGANTVYLVGHCIGGPINVAATDRYSFSVHVLPA